MYTSVGNRLEFDGSYNLMNYRKYFYYFLSIPVLVACKSDGQPNLSHQHETPHLILELDNTKLLVSEVTKNLDEPWEIAWGPDDHLWVTEHKGIVKRLNPTTGEIKDVLSIPDVYYSRTPGLLGMVLHPDFDSEPFVYVHYTYVDSSITEIDHLGRSSNVRSKIVRYHYDFEKDTLTNPESILPNIPGSGHHNGSRLAVTADKKLIFANGDTGNRKDIHHKNALVVKLLRMNLDGSIPDDNPVKGSYFYSMGHRNQQGLVAAKGKIYASEHGPNNDDEINLIRAGGDYGWPYVEGFCDKENELIYCDTVAVQEPLIAWTTTIAPAGLDFFDHPSIPEWQNSLMLTSLKGRSLQVFKLNESGEEIIDQKIYLQKQFGRYRDLCVSPSGEIFLITSNTDWHIERHSWMYDNVPAEGNDRIIRISVLNPRQEFDNLPLITEDSAQIRLFTQERINFDIPGAGLYVQHCASCHLPSGQGISDYVPPLIDNEWVTNKNKLIETTLMGMTGPIKVNGRDYDAVMPGFAVSLNDQEITEILNYIILTLNAQREPITVAEVSNIRKRVWAEQSHVAN